MVEPMEEQLVLFQRLGVSGIAIGYNVDRRTSSFYFQGELLNADHQSTGS